MDGYNPMLMDVGESENNNVIDKNFIVTAKSDDGEVYYVLSKNMQSTLKEYEKGEKKINIKGNPIIEKYKKFTVSGKEYYGVKKDEYGIVGSGDEKWFDSYLWEFNVDTKEAKFHGGETELSEAFKNMDIPSKYKGYTKKDEPLEENFSFDEIPL